MRPVLTLITFMLIEFEHLRKQAVHQGGFAALLVERAEVTHRVLFSRGHLDSRECRRKLAYEAHSHGLWPRGPARRYLSSRPVIILANAHDGHGWSPAAINVIVGLMLSMIHRAIMVKTASPVRSSQPSRYSITASGSSRKVLTASPAKRAGHASPGPPTIEPSMFLRKQSLHREPCSLTTCTRPRM